MESAGNIRHEGVTMQNGESMISQPRANGFAAGFQSVTRAFASILRRKVENCRPGKRISPTLLTQWQNGLIIFTVTRIRFVIGWLLACYAGCSCPISLIMLNRNKYMTVNGFVKPIHTQW